MISISKYSPSKYNNNHTFFSTDTEESFYVAGFIAADGCIKHSRRGGSPRITIEIAKKDRAFLETIRTIVGIEVPIRDCLRKNSKYNAEHNDCWSSHLGFSSMQASSDLQDKFGIGPRKSLTYEMPRTILDHSLFNHFLRGYFDGDGSFHTNLHGGRSRNSKGLVFSLRGTEKFLISVREKLEAECYIDHTTKIRTSDSIASLAYGGNVLVPRIASYLYKDATIYLDRKYQIVKPFLTSPSQTMP